MNTEACKPVGEHADAPVVLLNGEPLKRLPSAWPHRQEAPAYMLCDDCGQEGPCAQCEGRF